MQSSNRRRIDVFAPTEVIHALQATSEHGRTVIAAYLEELDGKLRLATSRELDARGKVSRLKEAINDAIQNTRGLPPECRTHLMDAIAGMKE